VTSAGATSEWKTEGEIGADAESFLAELSAVLIDSADNLMATAYTTGSGSGAPQGIVTGLLGTASEINGQGSEVLGATDPFDHQNSLGARFSANATFQAHIATLNMYRQFETTAAAVNSPSSDRIRRRFSARASTTLQHGFGYRRRRDRQQLHDDLRRHR
jgi:predicted phage gp36 major capsid-like protein